MNGLNEMPYRELMLQFLPRPIASEADYVDVQNQVDQLLDKGELSVAEEEYLDLLGTLIWAYEERTEDGEQYELRGVDLVKGLLQLHGLKQKDLVPIFRTESIVSAVLNRKRKLTVDQISRLALYFNLPHGLFFEPDDVTR